MLDQILMEDFEKIGTISKRTVSKLLELPQTHPTSTLKPSLIPPTVRWSQEEPPDSATLSKTVLTWPVKCVFCCSLCTDTQTHTLHNPRLLVSTGVSVCRTQLLFGADYFWAPSSHGLCWRGSHSLGSNRRPLHCFHSKLQAESFTIYRPNA